MHLYKTSINGNPNVGLYGIVTDTHVLLGKEVPELQDKEIEEVFGKPIARITIAGTSLIGVFCQYWNNTLLVPSIVFDHEKEALEALNIKYTIITTELTCLGNNILITNKKALLNPEFTEEEEKQVAEVLGVPCERRTIMDIEAIGSIGVIRNDKGLFHRDIHPTIVKELEQELGITITLGTLNMGNPYIKSGLLLGNEGFIVGEASGGPEIRNADEALGFIGEQ